MLKMHIFSVKKTKVIRRGKRVKFKKTKTLFQYVNTKEEEKLNFKNKLFECVNMFVLYIHGPGKFVLKHTTQAKLQARGALQRKRNKNMAIQNMKLRQYFKMLKMYIFSV